MLAGILGADVGVRQLDGFIGAVACFSKLSCLIGEDDVAGSYAAFCGALLVVAVAPVAYAVKPLAVFVGNGGEFAVVLCALTQRFATEGNAGTEADAAAVVFADVV